MKIVVVDDDMALLRSLKIVLGEEGHEIVDFSSPETAALYLARHPDIDVLILDYVMPGMTGEELLKHILTELPPGCKTIMVTGHREQIQSYKILQALGVSHILPKPLDLDQLCDLVGAPIH